MIRYDPEGVIDGDGPMVTTPPRLSGLCLQQQSFRKTIDPFIRTYVIENRLDKEEDEDDDSSDEDDDTSEEDKR